MLLPQFDGHGRPDGQIKGTLSHSHLETILPGRKLPPRHLDAPVNAVARRAPRMAGREPSMPEVHQIYFLPFVTVSLKQLGKIVCFWINPPPLTSVQTSFLDGESGPLLITTLLARPLALPEECKRGQEILLAERTSLSLLSLAKQLRHFATHYSPRLDLETQ